MKKAQKDQIKEGGELARGVYRAFMARPEWMGHVSKESLIRVLTSVLESEKAILAMMEKEVEKHQARHKEETDEEFWRGAKLTAGYCRKYLDLREVETLLQLFEGKDYFYKAPNMVHLDFSAACRIN